MKVRELIMANKRWEGAAWISVKEETGTYETLSLEAVRGMFGDFNVGMFNGFSLVVTSGYPSLFTFHDLYRRSCEIEPDTIVRIKCYGLQEIMLAEEADEKFGDYAVECFYASDIVLGERVGGTLKGFIFTQQEVEAEPHINVDGVKTDVRLGVWATELYGDCYVTYVDTDTVGVVNKNPHVTDFIRECAAVFEHRAEFMKKVLNCFYAHHYEPDLHFCTGFLYAKEKYDLAVRLLKLVRRYRNENN